MELGECLNGIRATGEWLILSVFYILDWSMTTGLPLFISMSDAIKQRIRDEARSLGFHSFGVTQVPIELRAAYYEQWIADGKHGTMAWMAN
ncbi:MAG: hypothetical protein NWR36_00455, partial [Opitutales bacterium]|nr:hypothetical protein [Opitutales bacterium]